MADSFTPNVNLRKPEVGHADDVWGGVAGLNGDLDILDAIFLATGLSTVAAAPGQPFAGVPGVGLRIGKGKVLNIEGQAQYKDPTDITKVGTFSSDLIATATTVDLKFPPVGGTIATKEILVATVTAAHPVGTILSGYYGPTAPSGYVFVDGRTIGDATSNATRANVDCERLFKHLWAITAQAQCPVLTSAGAASTRGATAQADWDAHKRFTLPNHSGRTLAGRDNLSGSAAGVWTGANTVGVVAGAITSSTGSITSSGNNTINFGAVGGTASGYVSGTQGQSAGPAGPFITTDVVLNCSTTINGNFTISVSGASSAFNIIQPSIVVDVIIAL